MRHNIFLIVKEALTNVLKHASASEVRVQAKASASTLEIVVQDDGQGFDSGETSRQTERRHGLGKHAPPRRQTSAGLWLWKASVGGGTTVLLTVNFPAWKAPAAASG